MARRVGRTGAAGTVGQEYLRGVFERFTQQGRRALVLAQEEARVLHHNFIGTEHLLLGILDLDDSSIAEVLGSFGIHAAAVRTVVGKNAGPADGRDTGTAPFTPRAKRVMELALREALQLGHDFISDGHLVLGLVREGEGVAVEVMLQLGGDLSQIRTAVVDRLTATHSLPRDPRDIHQDRPDEAHCPYCRARLQGTAQYRIIEVPAADGQPGDPISVTVVYCRRCRSVLPIHPPSRPPPSAD